MFRPTTTLLALAAYSAANIPANAIANDAISANATITNEYLFRGLSQTDRRFAFQGGLDWSVNGFFAGAWASNVDFAAAEIDLYGGYTVSTGQFSVTSSVQAYLYPDSDDLPGSRFDFIELGGAVAYEQKNYTLTSSFAYSPDFFEETGDAYYLAQSALWRAPFGLSFTSSIGRQWVENNDKLRKPDYWHWSASAAFTRGPVTLSATYSDTDINQKDCLAGATICSARALGAISVSF